MDAAPGSVTDRVEPAANGAAPSDLETETLKRRLLRLALDVHDGPMQNLAVIGLSLNNLRRRIETLVPDQHHSKLNASVEQIAAELGQVEHELRTLITALEDGATESVPVLEAVENEIREFTRRSDAKIELVAEGAVQAYTDSQRIALQAIVRSALANVAKHANADHVTVRLHGSDPTRSRSRSRTTATASLPTLHPSRAGSGWSA